MRYLVAFLLLFGFQLLPAQEKIPALKLDMIVIQSDSFLGYDNFGFHYFINDNIFFKAKDEKSLEYKNLSLGKISRVDLQNPLKIVLFYEDFNTIVTLDNQLNETGKVNLSDYPEPIMAAAVGMASQNRFWIYNSLTQQIGLYDYLKNIYTSITPPFKENIKYYDTDFNYFQWIDGSLNWYVCDIFGKITSLGKVPKSDKILIAGVQNLLYLADGQLFFYDAKNNKKYRIENIDKSYQSFFFKDQILSIFTNQGITNYKITIP